MRNKANTHSLSVSGGSESGFSMVELMFSIVIFLLVTGSIFGVMQIAQRSRTAVNQQVPLSKNARVALNIVGRDTLNAGYGYPLRSTVVLPDNRISALLGLPNDFGTGRDTVPPIIAGNNVTLNTFNTTAGVRTDQVTFLYKDTTFNVVGTAGPPDTRTPQPLNINAATTGGSGGYNQIIPISGSNAQCRVNDIYLITGNTGSTLGMATSLVDSDKVRFGNGDVLGLNLVGSTASIDGITAPASMQKVIIVTYMVTADGILIRREYGNTPTVPAVASVDEPLVYGVENFQIQYVMENGSLLDNPSAGLDGIPGNADDDQLNLAAVRQIRFTISLRTTETDSSGTPNRVSMTSTFSTRNLGYEAN